MGKCPQLTRGGEIVSKFILISQSAFWKFIIQCICIPPKSSYPYSTSAPSEPLPTPSHRRQATLPSHPSLQTPRPLTLQCHHNPTNFTLSKFPPNPPTSFQLPLPTQPKPYPPHLTAFPLSSTQPNATGLTCSCKLTLKRTRMFYCTVIPNTLS